MKQLIENVLNKYGVKHHDISTKSLAELIVAHMTIGFEGKRGWYWDSSDYDGQNEEKRKLIENYEEFSIR